MIQLPDLIFAMPLLVLAASSILALILEIIFKKSQIIVFYFCILSILASIYYSFKHMDTDITIFADFLRVNNAAYGFGVLILVSLLFTILSSKSYIKKNDINFSEFYCILMFSGVGMMSMVYANDILIVFLGLELMSICFYVMAGFLRKRPKSNESAMKYFLLGAFMTGFLLYGISLLYGVTSSTNLTKIFINIQTFESPVFIIGIGLFLIGFMFKIGIFPFHMWIPDVYEGAPTPISGMMSTAGKIAALGTITPIIFSNQGFLKFQFIFSILALLTMLYGNVIAIVQSNLKRLLAYSSIASAGYLMVGIASVNDFAERGIMFYLLAYIFMQLGAFIIISVIEEFDSDKRDYKRVSFNDYKGLAKNNPFLATMMTIFLFSLAGIPPLAGFWGKYYLFYAAIKSNLIWLSVLAILFSLVSVYYYLKVIVYMWFMENEEGNPEEIQIPFGSKLSIVLSFIGTMFIGIFPQAFFSVLNLK